MVFRSQAIFRARLKEAIEGTHLTQAEFSEKVGVEPSTVSRWCKGELWPKPEHLDKLALVLERPIAWFFADSTELETSAKEHIREIRHQLDNLERKLPSLDTPDRGRDSLQGD